MLHSRRPAAQTAAEAAFRCRESLHAALRWKLERSEQPGPERSHLNAIARSAGPDLPKFDHHRSYFTIPRSNGILKRDPKVQETQSRNHTPNRTMQCKGAKPWELLKERVPVPKRERPRCAANGQPYVHPQHHAQEQFHSFQPAGNMVWMGLDTVGLKRRIGQWI